MNRDQILGALGLAGVVKAIAYLANNNRAYLMLCPDREMAQSDSSLHHSFVAVSFLSDRQGQVRIKAGGRACMGAAMLIFNHSYRRLLIQQLKKYDVNAMKNKQITY
uniref:Uncharacterized protein n=1 Tax=Rhipicephalus zambeziensis TaxID=60191 RepID=A0A224Z273_9ACAR